jgi:hypothetical protein
MKKSIIGLLFSILLIFPTPVSAATPKFKVHVLRDLAPVCNYSINTPVVIDYDGDSDLDILLITKEGAIYFLENLRTP